MVADLDPGAAGDRIGELLDQLAATLDDDARAPLDELLGLVAAVHASALARVLELAGRHAGGEDLLAALAGDDLVASVAAGLGLEITATAPAGVPVALTPRERCDLCGAALVGEHDHLVRLEPRQLVCACRPCALLFDHDGAAAGTHRAIPDRWVALDPPGDAWEGLDVPVGLAFFVANSTTGAVDAGYPGPAGVTSSLLGLESWDAVGAQHPELAGLRPDVEAVLVRRGREGTEALIVPVDACYALAGELRSRWHGFDGGPAVRAAVDAFFEGARARAGVGCGSR